MLFSCRDSKCRNGDDKGGFALIISLGVMSVILLLILAMSATMRVHTKLAETEVKQDTAKLNARLAMKKAIAKLQKHLGPDQRVTARADIFEGRSSVNSDKSRWIGVFEGGEDNDSEITWLTSGSAPSISSSVDHTNAVKLLGLDSESNTDFVKIEKEKLLNSANETTGHYAFFIDDEGLKSKINLTRNENPSDGEKLGRAIIPSSNLLNELWDGVSVSSSDSKKIISFEQLKYINSDINLKSLAKDYTVYGYGLLTDVKNGGLKKDLTIAMEDDSVFNANLSGKWLMLDSRKSQVNMPYGFATWNILKDYYNLYKSHNGTIANYTAIPSIADSTIDNYDEFDVGPYEIAREYHTNSPITPTMHRYQTTYWVEYVQGAGNAYYHPRLHVRPLFSLYNPYNVAITMDRISQSIRTEPTVTVTVDNESPVSIAIDEKTGQSGSVSTTSMVAFGNYTLKPGEIMFFSYGDSAQLTTTSAKQMSNSMASIASATRWVEYDLKSRVRATGGEQINVKNALVAGVRTANGNIQARRNVVQTGSSAGGNESEILHYKHYFNFDEFSILSSGTKQGGKEMDAGTFQFDSASNTTSDPRTIGMWLRTSREDFHQLRALYDGNYRFMYGDGRWDQIPGLQVMAPYSASEVDQFSDTQAEMSINEPVHLNERGYAGGSIDDPLSSTTSMDLFDVPRSPLVSIGQFQHANVGRFSHEPSYISGNSYANVRIPLNDWKVSKTDTTTKSVDLRIDNSFDLYDTSYIVNEAIWDSYFFSTAGETINNAEFNNFKSTSAQLPNPRFKLYEPGNLDVLLSDFKDTTNSYNTNAGLLLVDGSFNVNSTSIEAWKAVLKSAKDQELPQYDLSTSNFSGWQSEEKAQFAKFSAPMGSSFDGSNNSEFWRGYRTLDDTQITALATAIVDQVKLRGPFNSFSEFVNRSLANDDTGKSGPLQAALDNINVNINNNLSSDLQKVASHSDATTNDRLSGYQGAGFPGYITQGDLLQSLAPFMTVRSDTFKIRSYGDSVNPVTGEVESQAWCEAIVQRIPDPVGVNKITSISELADTSSGLGRKFKIIYFRWLTEEDL